MDVKRRFVFSWLDWMILVIVVLIGAGVGLFLYQGRTDVPEPLTMTYVLAVTLPQDATASGAAPFAVGARVSNERGSQSMGIVVAVHGRPVLQPSVRDGTLVFIERDDRREWLVSVRAATEMDRDGMLRVGDVRIAAGLSGDFRIGDRMASGARIVWVKTEANA